MSTLCFPVFIQLYLQVYQVS